MGNFSRARMSALEDHLGYWLRRVSNEVSDTFARALREKNVTPAEWVALRLLHGEEKTTPGDLAELTGMTRGAISKVLEKLEAKSFIARTLNPDDSRVQWIALTRAGQRVVPELAAIADHNDRRFFGCLKSTERAALRRLLATLTDAHGLRRMPVD